MNVTVYVPGAVKACVGFSLCAVSPSPNCQYHPVVEPVLVFVNCTGVFKGGLRVFAVKCATGAMLGAITDVHVAANPLSKLDTSECHTISIVPDVQVTGDGKVLPEVFN